MSKRIISAILVMAMVISMSATALLSSVGAAAETEVDYEADRTALKAAIVDLVIYGPELSDNALTLLKDMGILTYNKDLNCEDCASKYNEIHARHTFWDKYADDEEGYSIDEFLFRADVTVTENDVEVNYKDLAEYFVKKFDGNKVKVAGKLAWATTGDDYIDLAKSNISNVVEYAASAWYFGKEANDTLVDPSFNEGRNAVVKNALGMINAIVDALKAEVGANENKPAGYAAYYMGETYKGFATTSKAYNQAIGFNPYLYIITEEDYLEDSYWNTALGQYTIRWYTFAEAREIDAEGVFAFETKIREMAIANGAKVLFKDFVAEDGEATKFQTIVKDLFSNLVGDIKDYFVYEDIDVQIKAFYELEKVIEIYDLYIKDVYNNIYTASAAELLNDVLYAKRVIDFVRGADDNKVELVALALTDFTAMTANIKASIKAVAPRAEQLLSQANIDEGTALIRKAEALLTNWASWESNDSYKDTWNALKNAKNNLKNMMPATVGGSTIIVVEKETFGDIKNFAGTEIKNDRVIVEFTPNWFAYVKFSALLKAQIENFTAAVTGQKGTLDEINLGKDDASALAAIINKYAFLAGIVGDVVEVKDGKIITKTFNKDASLIYSYYVFKGSMWSKTSVATNANDFLTAILHYEVSGDDVDTCLYEAVIGKKLGNNYYNQFDRDGENWGGAVDQDMAIENAYYFVDIFEETLRYALANDFSASTGSFDWTKEEGAWEFKSDVAKKIEALEAAIKNLTKDLTTEIQTYAWILWNIADVMDWDNIKWDEFEFKNGDKFTSYIQGIFGSDGKVWEDAYISFDALYDALEVSINVEDFMISIEELTITDKNITIDNTDIDDAIATLKLAQNQLNNMKLEDDPATTASNDDKAIRNSMNKRINKVIETLTNAKDAINAEVNSDFDWFLNKSEDEVNAKLAEKVEEVNANLATDLNDMVAEINSDIKATLDDLNSFADIVYKSYTGSAPCYTNADNYPKDYMKNVLAEANVLAKHIAELIEAWDKDNNKRINVATQTNLSGLVAAYNNFIDLFKTNILTEEGAAKFDKFVDDTYYVAEAALNGTDKELYWNEYDRLLQKLASSNLTLDKYLADAKTCYDYFAVTLKHVIDCEAYFTNLYLDNNGAVVVNLIKPLSDLVAAMDVTGYTRDWADNFQAVREVAAYINASIVKVADNDYTVNSDMPLWYALRVLSETQKAYDERANYTVAKLVEYKAGLEALLIEADGLNVYNYVSNTDEAKAIWADFVAAYANAQFVALDTRVEFAKVDEAVATLEAAMAELAKIEAPEGAADADALAAKIEAAKALYARADVTTADKTELELAIAAAEKVLMFNISVLNSTDIEEEIKALDDLMNALLDTMYTGKDLKKATKVLELQVVVDLYTEASYRKFANAVEAAYAMADEDTATESAMKAAYANVESRFGDLKLAPVEEEPEVVEPETSVVMEEAIAIYNDAANGYDKAVEGCTAESAAAYNAAINTLKADIENNADDAKLLESIIALNLAKAALTVDVPETCDC